MQSSSPKRWPWTDSKKGNEWQTWSPTAGTLIKSGSHAVAGEHQNGYAFISNCRRPQRGRVRMGADFLDQIVFFASLPRFNFPTFTSQFGCLHFGHRTGHR